MQCSDILYANKTSLWKKALLPFPSLKPRYTGDTHCKTWSDIGHIETHTHSTTLSKPPGDNLSSELTAGGPSWRSWGEVLPYRSGYRKTWSGAGWSIACPQSHKRSQSLQRRTKLQSRSQQQLLLNTQTHTHAKLKRVLQPYLLTGFNFSESYKHCLKQLHGTVTLCGPLPAGRGTEVQSSCLKVQNYTHFIVHLMLQWRSHAWLNRKPK